MKNAAPLPSIMQVFASTDMNSDGRYPKNKGRALQSLPGPNQRRALTKFIALHLPTLHLTSACVLVAFQDSRMTFRQGAQARKLCDSIVEILFSHRLEISLMGFSHFYEFCTALEWLAHGF